MEDEIKKLFYDPKTGFISATKLKKKLKQHGYDIPLSRIQEVLNNQKVVQVYKQLPKKQYNSIVANESKHIYQADLLDVHQSAKFNEGYKFILCIIDVYSRYALAIPLKSKSEQDVYDGFVKGFKVLGFPQELTTDNEAAILSRKLQNYFDKHKIIHVAINPERKMNTAIVERFNKTLREKFRAVLFNFKTNKWVDYLEPIIENYNNTIHSTIKAKPIDVFEGRAENKQKINNPSMSLFAVGDKVRYELTPENIFSKGSVNDKYSSDVLEVVGQRGYNIIIQDSHGKTYEKLPRELQLVQKVEEPVSEKDDSFKEELKTAKKEIKQSKELKALQTDATDKFIQPAREKRERKVNQKYK